MSNSPAAHRRRGARPRVTGCQPLGRLARLGLACEIALAYLRAKRELRRAPLATALAHLRTDAPPVRVGLDPERSTREQAVRLGRAVVRTLPLLPGDTRCLTRSLVLARMLARRGIPATLVIGTRTDPEFAAHAWLECEGAAVLPPGDGSFARLVEL